MLSLETIIAIAVLSNEDHWKSFDSMIRSQVDIGSMQLGFIPGWGTTDAIFILRQLQEKYIGKHKPLYFAFVDLEKAFDRVPRQVLWCTMKREMGNTCS